MAIGGSPPNAPREKDGTKGTAGRYGFVAEVLRGYLGGLWLARDPNDASERGTVLVRHLAPVPTASARAAILDAARWAQAAGGSTLEIIEARNGVDLVTPFGDAEPLRSVLRTAALKHAVPDPSVLLGIARDILEQLESFHDAARGDKSPHGFGGLHPDSILVGTDGNVQLIDAGIAAAASAREPWKSDVQRVGYLAPEQLDLRGVADARTDVFALGIQLWEAFGNRRLFPGADAKSARDRIQKGPIPRLDAARGTAAAGVATPIADLVARALERDPAKRFQTAEEMEAAIVALEPADAARIGAWVAGLADTAIAKRRQFLERIAQGGPIPPGVTGRPSAPPSMRPSVPPASVRPSAPPASAQPAPATPSTLACPPARSSTPPPAPSERSSTPPPPSLGANAPPPLSARPSVPPRPSNGPSAAEPAAAAEPASAPEPASDTSGGTPVDAASVSEPDSSASAAPPAPAAPAAPAAMEGGAPATASSPEAAASPPEATSEPDSANAAIPVEGDDASDADAMDVTDDELGAPPSPRPPPPSASLRPSLRTSRPPTLPHAEAGDTSLLGAPAEPLASPFGTVSQLGALTSPSASARRGKMVLAVGAALALGVGVGGWLLSQRRVKVREVEVTPTLEAHVESVTAVPTASAPPSPSGATSATGPGATTTAAAPSAATSAATSSAATSASAPEPAPAPSASVAPTTEAAHPAPVTSAGSAAHAGTDQPAAHHAPHTGVGSGYKPGGI